MKRVCPSCGFFASREAFLTECAAETKRQQGAPHLPPNLRKLINIPMPESVSRQVADLGMSIKRHSTGGNNDD